MSRKSMRVQNLSNDKNYMQGRLTESLSVKTLSRSSYWNSILPSSTSSLNNISINFQKNCNIIPQLFTNYPKLFTINNGLSSQNIKGNNKNYINFISGYNSVNKTPNNINNINNNKVNNNYFQKDFSKKNQKKNNQNHINHKKKIGNQKICYSGNSVKKQIKSRTPLNTIPDYQSSLSSCISVDKVENIKIIVRIKPTEIKSTYVMPYIIKIDDNHIRVDGKTFAYDNVFSGDSSQEEVFQKVAKPAVSGLFEGYNGTIFAYGQTGSGKTYTIFGGDSKGSEGLIYRSIYYIFSNIKNESKVSMSLLEIYKQQLIDLLNENKADLKIKQTSLGGVVVEGQLKLTVEDANKTLAIINKAQKLRRVACTKLNEKSSRSHTILTIYIEDINSQVKLCLIDLAGSQKASKSGANGQNFEEMKKINYSLSCLGNVINALVTRKKSDHIPFRDSKLTRLLKDSLSGRFRTSIIVNCSSDSGTQDETISSLKFADRAKKVKITISKNINKGKQNIEYLQRVIQRLTNDLQNTKRELTKYKQICVDKGEECVQKQQVNKKYQSPQITARQTIPSERVHLDQQIKKYGKQNININMIAHRKRDKIQTLSINFSELSSLNVSKTTLHKYAEINSPSISSLTCRADQNLYDVSFHFSSLHGTDLQEKIQ